MAGFSWPPVENDSHSTKTLTSFAKEFASLRGKTGGSPLSGPSASLYPMELSEIF